MAYLVDFTSNPQDRASFVFDPPAPPLRDHLDINRGLTFDQREVPTRAVVVSAHRQLSSIVPINGWWGVSETFRDMVETRECGVHQFFAIEIVLSGGVRPAEPYWIFNIRQRIDAVIVDRSQVEWTHFPGKEPVMNPPNQMWPGERPYPLCLNRGVIAGRHVWRGDKHLSVDVFFSDHLIAEYKKNKMRGLRLKYCEEI
jgi:hypothetical protein